MNWTAWAAVSLGLAALPALLYLRNTFAYRPPRKRVRMEPPSYKPEAQAKVNSFARASGLSASAENTITPVSVLIPARNEERSIRAAVESVLASEGIEFEVVVLDDHSTDRTREIVAELAARDRRVRIELSPPLPAGWCGKQHACFQLSKLARNNTFVFLDADVRLAPDGLARICGFLDEAYADLVSGFPRQETGTWLEKLLIPLIHFILLGFLPIARMRKSKQPGMGAGCGQLFAARRGAYETVGGHAAVKTSLHDGVTLPRAFRKAGFRTDLCDATDLAACRMYRSASEVWFGLAKNAREGLGAPLLLPFATAILFLGQVFPFVLLGFASEMEMLPLTITIAAALAAYYPRIDAVVRFRQSLFGAILHPIGILLLLAIQWYANFRKWFGKPAGWKGREYG